MTEMNPRERYLSVYDEDGRNKLDRVPTFVQGVKGEFIAKYEEQLFDEFEEDLTYSLQFDGPIVLGFDAVFAAIPQSSKSKGAILKDEEGNEHSVGLSGQISREGSTFYNKGLIFSQENIDQLWASLEESDNSSTIISTIEFHERVEEKIFPVVMIGGIFDRVWMGMQMKNFARNYRKNTKLYKDVIKYFAEIMKINVKGLIEATGGRAGIVNILDDVAFKGNPMISPKRWEEDIGPYYEEICKMIRQEGMIAQIHTDGDVTDLIPSFQKVGFQGLQGWEGGMNPHESVKKFPDFVAVGYGDVSHIIPHGTKDEIENHVKDLMIALKENRHYIFGPSTVVQGDDAIDNVRYFMACGKKYGKY